MTYYITQDCIGCLACKRICPSGAVSGNKKEQHAIDAEICIECGACGRVCPSQAVEDSFGLTPVRIKRKKWDLPRIDTDICMSCNICIDTCPTGALDQTLKHKGNLHTFPFLEDRSLCIGCGFCAADCPVSAITMGVDETYLNVEKEA